MNLETKTTFTSLCLILREIAYRLKSLQMTIRTLGRDLITLLVSPDDVQPLLNGIEPSPGISFSSNDFSGITYTSYSTLVPYLITSRHLLEYAKVQMSGFFHQLGRRVELSDVVSSEGGLSILCEATVDPPISTDCGNDRPTQEHNRVYAKILRPSCLNDPFSLTPSERAYAGKRFMKEVVVPMDLYRMLRHYDPGTEEFLVETLEGGFAGIDNFLPVPYLFFPVHQGLDLQKKLDLGGPLDIYQAVSYLARISKVLAAMHTLGKIHRDIKPGNIFITDEETPKLLDFGIIKDYEVRSEWRRKRILGTPSYMAPELFMEDIREYPEDNKTDVFELMATFLTITTGRPWFEFFGCPGQSVQEIIRFVMNWMVGSNSEDHKPQIFHPEYPDEVNRLIMETLVPHPRDRPQMDYVSKKLDSVLRD